MTDKAFSKPSRLGLLGAVIAEAKATGTSFRS